MKYKLLKDLPLAKAGTEVTLTSIESNNYSTITFVNHLNQTMNAGEIMNRDIPKWVESIVEKKTYDDLEEGDTIFWIGPANGKICEGGFLGREPRSEAFLTREEAEDEHRRREWACRKDKFVPEDREYYWQFSASGGVIITINKEYSLDCLAINHGLAFRTREECEKAIKEHDLIRLFYTIR